jgi:hypothetical protein
MLEMEKVRVYIEKLKRE